MDTFIIYSLNTSCVYSEAIENFALRMVVVVFVPGVLGVHNRALVMSNNLVLLSQKTKSENAALSFLLHHAIHKYYNSANFGVWIRTMAVKGALVDCYTLYSKVTISNFPILLYMS